MEDMLREQNWLGFFLEDFRGKGWMNIRLQFVDGVMRGEGVDYVGTWYLDGSYSLDDLNCSWIKRYLGQHEVQYDGRISDVGILGQWNIQGLMSNQFHIWPASMTHIQQEYLAAEDPLNSDPNRSASEEMIGQDELNSPDE